MNDQEAFDKVCKHLLAQMKKAKRPNSTGDLVWCAYRGQDNLMCAVGCLIPDDEYFPDMENVSLNDIRDKVSSLQTVSLGLLIDLQNIHDKYDTERWKGLLKQLAHNRGLTFNVG